MGVVFYITCEYYIENWLLAFELQNMEVNGNETISCNSIGDDDVGFNRMYGFNGQ